MGHPFTCKVRVWKPGYEWRHAGDHEDGTPHDCPNEDVLIPKCDYRTDEIADENNWRTYDLFKDEPGLFLTFTRLERTPDAFKAFADRYGLVDDPMGHRSIMGPRKSLRFSRWSSEISYLHVLLQVGAIKSKTVQERRRILETLSGMASNLDVEVRISLSITSPSSFAVEADVHSLTGGLWLQALDAVKEQRQFRNCAWGPCSKPIPVSPEYTGSGRRGRSDRQFCSDSCRVKSYLKRRETAARLRAEGMKLRSIATEVGTDLETLKKWLGEK